MIAINKFDKRGSLDALRDVKKQWKRNHNAFAVADDDIPVYGTIASQFNDPGMNRLYRTIMDIVTTKTGAPLVSRTPITAGMSEKRWIIPPERTRYLAEIVETCEGYDTFVKNQSAIARRMYQLHGTIEALRANVGKKRLEIVEPTGPGDVVQVTQRVEGEPAYLGELELLYRDLEGRLRARVQAAARRVAGHEASLRGREVSVPGARQGRRARSRVRVALAPAHPEGLAPQVRRLG